MQLVASSRDVDWLWVGQCGSGSGLAGVNVLCLGAEEAIITHYLSGLPSPIMFPVIADKKEV